MRSYLVFFFFFNDTATTEIYTLSLHDALPICGGGSGFSRWSGDAGRGSRAGASAGGPDRAGAGHRRRLRHGAPRGRRDRKSTRLNSSHANISYAVFCLKKKKHNTNTLPTLLYL